MLANHHVAQGGMGAGGQGVSGERMIHIIRLKLDKIEVDSLRSFRTEDGAYQFLQKELLTQRGYYATCKSCGNTLHWKEEPEQARMIKKILDAKSLMDLTKFISSGDQLQREFHVVWN